MHKGVHDGLVPISMPITSSQNSNQTPGEVEEAVLKLACASLSTLQIKVEV